MITVTMTVTVLNDNNVMCRVVAVSAQSLCGRLATAARSMTTATVMDTQTVYTLCLSAVPRRTAMCLGTRRHVPPR